MDMKLLLFIFTVSWSVTGGESALSVSLYPRFPSSRVYVSDEVTLRCKEAGTVLNSDVTWYKDNKILTRSAEVHIPAAQVTDSGLYACQKGSGVKSDNLEITVLNMVPRASLSVINTVNTVMGAGEAVLMKLFVKEGLNGWRCRYSEGAGEYWENSLDDESNKKTSVVIHAEVRVTPGRTYWCMNTKEEREDCPRSNAIKLTVTGKTVALQVSNRPAWKGDNVSLTCEVWGGPEVKNAVFSHNGTEIHRSSQTSYVIHNVNQSNAGNYTCATTYAYSHINTKAADHFHSSDGQSLMVIDGPPVAHIDCQSQTCSCSDCKGALTPVSWEFSAAGATETEILQGTESNMMSQEYGRPYKCAALFNKGRSRFSNSCDKSSAGINSTVLVVVLLFVLGMLFLLLGLWMCKRRRESGKKRMKGLEDGADGGYEEVGSEKKKAEKEGEYELLKVDQAEKDKAQYETLQGKGKEEGKAEGEYEALKGGEAEGGVYHTVKEQGEGKGHYEALKTAQVEVYHTLKDPAQAQEQGQVKGEYEPLKTAQTEVYHTLGKEQGAGEAEEQKAKEESPYEELKAEKK